MRPVVAFAQNALFGDGGQGECLRQMSFTLDQLPLSRIYSRYAVANSAACVNLPLRRSVYALTHRLVQGVPMLRGRQDWLTLLSDLDFDRRVKALVEGVDLFDGVMGQCCDTLRALDGGKTRIVVTSLNSHIDHLEEVLRREHERIGFSGPSFIHPRMKLRVHEELERAGFIRVLSAAAKRTFLERGIPESKIRVVPHGVDLGHFHPVPKKDGVFRVVAIARITPRKGIHHLLQAFEEARIPDSELVLIGATGDRWSSKMLQAFLARNKNIRVQPMDVPGAPVERSLGPASVLVHPALEDGFGLVIPQALAAGRPVIATRQSGASELIQHGKNGFLVEAGDPAQIKEHLRLLAADSKLLEAMGQAAPEAVRRMDYGYFARATLSFYEEVHASGPLAKDAR